MNFSYKSIAEGLPKHVCVDDRILLSDLEMARKEGWTMGHDGDQISVYLFKALYGGSINPAQGPEVIRYSALKSGIPAIRHISTVCYESEISWYEMCHTKRSKEWLKVC